MPTASDFISQRREAEKQLRETRELIVKQRRVLEEQISKYKGDISSLQELLNKAQNDLSRLAI